jgi:hypothetical protein
MRTIHLIALAASSLLTTSSSCKKEDSDTASPCPTVDLPTAQVLGWTTTPTCFVQSLTAIGQVKTYVVNSDADYRAAFTCSALPAVDFNKFTLLVGETKTANSTLVTSQQVVQKCAAYAYSVTLQNGLASVVSTVAFHALVPKLPVNAKIDFKVQVLP